MGQEFPRPKTPEPEEVVIVYLSGSRILRVLTDYPSTLESILILLSRMMHENDDDSIVSFRIDTGDEDFMYKYVFDFEFVGTARRFHQCIENYTENCL